MFATKLVWTIYMLSFLFLYGRLVAVSLFNNKFLTNSDTIIMSMLIPLWPLMLVTKQGRKYLSKLFY